MALTKNGNRIGRAAQAEHADLFNQMVEAALNMTPEESEKVKIEINEEKTEAINEFICAQFAPARYEKICEFKQIRKAYRDALRKLANELQADEIADAKERADLYITGMGG